MWCPTSDSALRSRSPLRGAAIDPAPPQARACTISGALRPPTKLGELSLSRSLDSPPRSAHGQFSWPERSTGPSSLAAAGHRMGAREHTTGSMLVPARGGGAQANDKTKRDK